MRSSSCATSAATRSITRTASRGGASGAQLFGSPDVDYDARDLPAAPVQQELRAAPAATGTRRRTPTRTSPRRSRSGSATPEREWRERYRGWKALEKLEYVDELMREAAAKRRRSSRGGAAASPTRASCARPSRATTPARRKLWAEDYPDFYDADLRAHLRRGEPGGESAARFMRRRRKAHRAVVVRWTGAAQVRRRRIWRASSSSAARSSSLHAPRRRGALALDLGGVPRGARDQPPAHGTLQEVG